MFNWIKKIAGHFVLFIGLVIIITLIVFGPKMGLKFDESEKRLQNVDVWVNLDRQVAFIDKQSGKLLIIINPELAKEVMIAQLKLYEFEELQALKKGEH